MLSRGDCIAALSALWKDSFRSPAMQNFVLCFNELFLRACAQPPLFQHGAGEYGKVMKAGGVDGLSRGTAEARWHGEATTVLRELITAEAAQFGESISIDLFATANNALVPRFYARHKEPLAEGMDARAQPDWGRSACLHCGLVRREFAFASLNRGQLPRFLAKARADGMRGIIIAPFTPSSPVWPALMVSSITMSVCRNDRCIVVLVQRLLSSSCGTAWSSSARSALPSLPSTSSDCRRGVLGSRCSARCLARWTPPTAAALTRDYSALGLCAFPLTRRLAAGPPPES